jgi:hypothetical protein
MVKGKTAQPRKAPKGQRIRVKYKMNSKLEPKTVCKVMVNIGGKQEWWKTTRSDPFDYIEELAISTQRFREERRSGMRKESESRRNLIGQKKETYTGRLPKMNWIRKDREPFHELHRLGRRHREKASQSDTHSNQGPDGNESLLDLGPRTLLQEIDDKACGISD